MKINVSFENFKKNHKKKKSQILFVEEKCLNYKKVENIFNLILSKKIVLYSSLWKRGKIGVDTLS